MSKKAIYNTEQTIAIIHGEIDIDLGEDSSDCSMNELKWIKL